VLTRTKASSRGCSASSRAGSPRTGSRRCRAGRRRSAASACSRARTRSSRAPARAAGRSLGTPALAHGGQRRRPDRDRRGVLAKGSRRAARPRPPRRSSSLRVSVPQAAPWRATWWRRCPGARCTGLS
jgi:hypothetical protein